MSLLSCIVPWLSSVQGCRKATNGARAQIIFPWKNIFAEVKLSFKFVEIFTKYWRLKRVFIYVKSLMKEAVYSSENNTWAVRWLRDIKSQLIILDTFKSSCHARAICFCRVKMKHESQPLTKDQGIPSVLTYANLLFSFLSPVSLLAQVWNIRTVDSLVLTSSN